MKSTMQSLREKKTKEKSNFLSGRMSSGQVERDFSGELSARKLSGAAERTAFNSAECWDQK